MSYPPGSEAVDNQLTSQIEGLRGSMEKGFDRIERRLEEAVTRSTFEAQVTRLDQADKHLEDKLDGAFNVLKSEMESGFADIESRDEKRDAQAAARDAARDSKFGRRITWLLTCVALGFTGVQFALNLLVK